ncbi:MAG: 50S ribosomal protein L21 [Patescibacteria group bacterium]
MNEFAVIKTGGKQYKISKGDTILIEKIKSDEEPKVGDKIIFDNVLMVDNGKDTTLGDPYINGAKVIGVLMAEGKGKKITVIRYKAKSRYFKKKGHRQPYFKVKIESIK